MCAKSWSAMIDRILKPPLKGEGTDGTIPISSNCFKRCVVLDHRVFWIRPNARTFSACPCGSQTTTFADSFKIADTCSKSDSNAPSRSVSRRAGYSSGRGYNHSIGCVSWRLAVSSRSMATSYCFTISRAAEKSASNHCSTQNSGISKKPCLCPTTTQASVGAPQAPSVKESQHSKDKYT